MTQFKKVLILMTTMFLLMPAAAFAQENSKAGNKKTELTERINPSLPPKMKKGKPFTQSKADTKQSIKPNDFPLIEKGDFDVLYDSMGCGHMIVFDRVEQYSSKEKMNVKIGYGSESECDDLKDGYVGIEFFKESSGKLKYLGYTIFDTYGEDMLILNTIIPKNDYKGQKYIYIRLGVFSDPDDDYYSDVTAFKVKNPFYSPPDTTPPSVPSVSPVSDKDKKVTGKAEAGSTVTVKAGNKVLGSAPADKTGKFAVPLKSAQKAGTVLSVTATDKAGNVSKARKVTVMDKTPPPAPKVNKVTVKSTAVTGKTEANATVYVKVGKKVIGSAKASKSGSYSVKIKKQKAGTVLYVYAKDKAGNTGKATKTTVKEK